MLHKMKCDKPWNINQENRENLFFFSPRKRGKVRGNIFKGGEKPLRK